MSERGASFESVADLEKQVDLSSSVIGIRVFKVGLFDEASLAVFKHQVDTVKTFSEKLTGLSNKPPKVVLITNADLDFEGVVMLGNSGLTVIQVAPEKTKRRARLATKLLGPKSASKGAFSYVDMLNSLNAESRAGVKDAKKDKKGGATLFTSYDLAQKPEVLSRQMAGMKILYDRWEEKQPGKLAIVGSLLGGVHDMELVDGAIHGSNDITLDTVSRAFPNNALSLVPPHTRFSGIADNALAGEVEINGKQEPIGGNEDFLYAFTQMLYSGKDAVLLVEPCIEDEREGEVKGVEAKYERRRAIYRLYATRAVEKLMRTPWPLNRQKPEWKGKTLDAIVEEVLDNHLFFARIDERGDPEILLTKRQKDQKIVTPI